jgi:hypothetical protein
MELSTDLSSLAVIFKIYDVIYFLVYVSRMPSFLSNATLFSLSRQVAYVLGKLQNKTASNALSTVLKNVCEHPTVRHEAAEALGSMRVTNTAALARCHSFTNSGPIPMRRHFMVV